jgi:hypothetical protein
MRMLPILTCLFAASLAQAAPKPEAELRKLVDVQVSWARDGGFEDDSGTWLAPKSAIAPAQWIGFDKGQPPPPEQLGRMIVGEGLTKYKVDAFAAHVAPDGQSAVITFILHVWWRVSSNDPDLREVHDYRASELVTKTKDGWRVTAGLWSEAEPNAEINKAAKAGKLEALPMIGTGGDKSLLDAFTKLTTGTFDDAAAKRKDLVAIGSGPKERTVGGASLAKAWQAAWANRLTIDATLASSDPKATLGFVLANVTLAKKDYKIPFRVLFVFERKTDADPWSVVHAHFAVPAPTL